MKGSMDISSETPSHIHPLLAAQIEAAKDAKSILVADIVDGQKVQIQTRNTSYEVDRVGDLYFIQGSLKYCPERAQCFIMGSTFGGSVLKVGHIVEGMRLEFILEDNSEFSGKRISTSPIVSINGPQ
jgi:hypothetical protein